MEMGETEFMVRGLGYIKGVNDLKSITIGTNKNTGTPIYLKDVANIDIGPELRRGLADWNGEGEVVGGIIIQRFGENALAVIERVKKRLEELKSSLPDDVEIVTAYDRSALIDRAVDFLSDVLLEEGIIVALVIIGFLLHFRSSLVAIFTLPTAVLAAMLVMKMQGINANIMSLGGIAIAIGAMVDAAIIMIENSHSHILHNQLLPEEKQKPHWALVIEIPGRVVGI